MPNLLERFVAAEEHRTQRQISKDYNDALQAAIRKTREFQKRAADVEKGKIKPPPSLKTEKQIEGWKRAYKTRAAKQMSVVQKITQEMHAAGVKARTRIMQSMTRVYEKSRQITIDLLSKQGRANLPEMSRRQIQTLLYGKGNMRAFTKIAFNRLAVGKDVSAKLRREMAKSIEKGETKEQLLKRIMKVTGAEEKDAMRILRTESTYVESQAQQDAAEEYYQETGKKPMKRWNCVFINSRETHMEMHGQTVPIDEPFESPSGALLMFPGDSSAPPEEVINCQCYMEVFDSGSEY